MHLISWVCLCLNAIQGSEHNDFLKFLNVENYKLNDAAIEVVNGSNWSPVRCTILCNQVENCKSLSVRKDETKCLLFGVSVFGIGSNPVRDDDWQTLGKPGMRCT